MRTITHWIINFQVDLLKSALEINHGKISNPMLRKDEKTSDQSLRSIHAESVPKLWINHSSKNTSFIEVLDEVIEMIQTSLSGIFEL